MTEVTNADKMVRRIQALMDKADSTEFGPERDSLREKANELMVKFAISEFELDEARASRGEKRINTPVTVDMLIPLEPSALSGYYTTLFAAICNSLGLRQVRVGNKRDDNDVWCRAVKVVGYEADVKFAQMLYLSLRLEMLKMLAPTVDPSATYDANVFTLHEAGVKWETICNMMNKHVQVEWETVPGFWKGNQFITRKIASEVGPWGYTPWPDGGRLKRAHKRECALRGVDHYAVINAENYRAYFADGFTTRIAARLRNGRDEAGTALVLRKRQEDVDDMFRALMDELFPPVPAPPVDPNAKPSKAVKVRQPKVRYRSVDYGAMDRGRQAANRASLSRPGSGVNSGSAKPIR